MLIRHCHFLPCGSKKLERGVMLTLLVCICAYWRDVSMGSQRYGFFIAVLIKE